MQARAIGLLVIPWILLGWLAGAEAQQKPAPAGKEQPPPDTTKPIEPATSAPDEPPALAPEAEPTPSDEGEPGAAPPAKRPQWEDIVVVPRKAVLKSGRLELSPFTGISLNDVLIRHYAFGGDINYYLTDVFTVGLQGQYFIKERTERESLVGLQYQRIPTLNKFLYSAAFHLGYVPGYGKFALFNRYIWHWDILVSGGVGLFWTEIIPRNLGDKTFKNQNLAPDFGIGARLFINDWLMVSTTFRDYMFNDTFEPTNRTAQQPIDQVQRNGISQFVHNMMLYASVSVYLPMSFQYKLPR